MEDRQRRGAILHSDWQQKFDAFAKNLQGADVYVTVDLDCLRPEDAMTNWESGRFAADDIEWSLGKLRERRRIIGADICGAYSKPKYARWKQKFASEWDHPKLELPAADEIRRINFAALERLWPALTH